MQVHGICKFKTKQYWQQRKKNRTVNGVILSSLKGNSIKMAVLYRM